MTINALSLVSKSQRRTTVIGLAAVLCVSTLIAAGAARSAEADLSIFAPNPAASTVTVDHGAWDQLLAQYVKADASGLNRVDYAAWKAKGHDALKAYVAALEKTDVTKLGRAEQYAFWLNLYNAKTIDVVLDHYPVGSIREITINEGFFGFLKKNVGAGGPWKAKIMTVNGQSLSLDNIEHDILRPKFKDARVHYGVNCASVGCPNLDDDAFTGATLETQLTEGARAYVNSPRGVIVAADGSVTVSSIYNWFSVDFGQNPADVLNHIRQYANDDVKAKLAGKTEIASYDYDWSLNDAKR